MHACVPQTESVLLLCAAKALIAEQNGAPVAAVTDDATDCLIDGA